MTKSKFLADYYTFLCQVLNIHILSYNCENGGMEISFGKEEENALEKS